VSSSYPTFSATDFVIDDAFLKHQLSPTPQSKAWWNEWLLANPHKQETWDQAVQLLEAVRLGLNDYTRTYLSPETEAMLLLRIQATNRTVDEHEEETIAYSWWNRSWVQYAAAACFIGLMGIGWLGYRYIQTPVAPYQAYVSALDASRIEKVNEGKKNLYFKLPDGSSVTLFPNSKISFDGLFGKQNRSVYLSGKAFFEVVKQPHSPFFVYANELVTKVLGTSFFVQAYPNDKQVEVQVKTGKVSVFTQNDPAKAQKLSNRELEGIVLTPNQQITLNRQELRLSRTLVPEPTILVQPALLPSFEFEEASVPQVLEQIEKAYGVHIVYDPELLATCTLTASLSEESLSQKINLICQAIGATTETIDAQIIIYSKGCK